MTLSLIIPTLKQPDNVYGLLSSVMAQTFPKDCYEVLVIANTPCAKTRQICDSFMTQGLKALYLETGTVGVSTARNCGLQNATGDICIFLDDDCLLPQKNWLELVSDAFDKDASIDGTGGLYNLTGKYTFWGLIYHIKFRSWLNYYASGGRAFRLIGGCMAFRRHSIASLRFNDQIRFGGSETYFILKCLSLNLKLTLNEELSVDHSFDLSFKSFATKVYRQGLFHKKSADFEKTTMKNFIPEKTFQSVQHSVINTLPLSKFEKFAIPFGLRVHKLIFYWNSK